MIKAPTIGMLVLSFAGANGQEAPPDFTGLWRSTDHAGIAN